MRPHNQWLAIAKNIGNPKINLLDGNGQLGKFVQISIDQRKRAYTMVSLFRTLVVMSGVMWLPQTSNAEDWLLVETHKVPNQCAHPLLCVAQAKLASRHLLNLSTGDRRGFYDFLDNVASIKDIPDGAMSRAHHVDPEQLHGIAIAPKLKPLENHPGVYFDSTKLDGDAITEGFSNTVRAKVSALGLRLLTKEEWEKTPGRPTLSIRFTARLESAGCIVPFAVYMTIKEDLILVRDPRLKIEATVWTSSRRQNLANTNYSPESALIELLKKFEDDWRKANPDK